MGRFLSRGGARRVLSIFLPSEFLCSNWQSRFFAPTHSRVEPVRTEPVKDGRVAPPARAWSLTGFEQRKLRGGGPILYDGIKAVVCAGTPPPRTVIGRRNVADCAETVFLDRALPSVCRADDDTLGYDAVANEVPQGDKKLARQGHDHLRDVRAFLVRISNHFVKALWFWNLRKRHASWTIPFRTRALPDRKSPFSRLLLPLSSGESVSPP
jgi:hypothetical protein